jgi:ATP-dependent NAD(P)H-hydrate dehydratase
MCVCLCLCPDLLYSRRRVLVLQLITKGYLQIIFDITMMVSRIIVRPSLLLFCYSRTTTALRQFSAMTWQDKCILPLSSQSHKGSSGRVAVLGGSARYTGAPYYAAMAALQTGADLAYVFCAQEAALPIKCYSPELMVAPVYSAQDFDAATSEAAPELIQAMVDQVVPSLKRLHCLIIGPGLGRCPLVFSAVEKIIKEAIALDLFLVLDADALFMLSLEPYRQCLQGYSKVILTPNAVEYTRLFENELYGFASATIVKKGLRDVIFCAGKEISCEEVGGLKRSGGIGDILAGTLGTLVAWHVILKSRGHPTDLGQSCWAACCFVKRATKKAFDTKQRAMTAPSVLEELGACIQDTIHDGNSSVVCTEMKR